MDTETKVPATLARWKAKKIVAAGEITEVVEAGCYVRELDGIPVLLTFDPGMTARYQPKVGDYWVTYTNQDGGKYHAISPRAEFLAGYDRVPA